MRVMDGKMGTTETFNSEIRDTSANFLRKWWWGGKVNSTWMVEMGQAKMIVIILF